MLYFETDRTDAAYNLAAEAYFLQKIQKQDVLFLWQNSASVIIGKNQCVAQEVNIKLAQQKHIPIIRRDTGGGAVFHDLGNLNFSYITADTPEIENPYETFLEPLIQVLAVHGITALFNGRNDLCVEGRKVSGSAARVSGGRLLHHGTLLICSDLTFMTQLLTPSKEKLRRNGVASVRSRVANLQTFAPNLTADILKRDLAAAFHLSQPTKVDADMEAEIIRLCNNKYANPAWNFSK